LGIGRERDQELDREEEMRLDKVKLDYERRRLARERSERAERDMKQELERQKADRAKTAEDLRREREADEHKRKMEEVRDCTLAVLDNLLMFTPSFNNGERLCRRLGSSKKL
jgi:hypothetical protein